MDVDDEASMNLITEIVDIEVEEEEIDIQTNSQNTVSNHMSLATTSAVYVAGYIAHRVLENYVQYIF